MRQFAISFALSYLTFFARLAVRLHKPEIIGIAGSVGKSSTRSALEAMLQDYFLVKSVGNSETGIPLGILGLTPGSYSLTDWLTMLLKAPFGLNFLKNTKYLIAEMGIDDPFPPKNMEHLLTIIKPDIAIILNESATHSEQFEKTLSAEDKGQSEEEKVKLIIRKIAEEDCKIITQSGCKTAIYNADDENINAVIAMTCRTKQSHKNTQLVPFGRNKTNAISYKDYEVSLNGTSFSFSSTMQQSNNEAIKIIFYDFILPQEYQQVFASAIIAALQTGLKPEQVKKSLEKNFSLPKGRSSLLRGINNSVVIDSSYNASKASNFAFLDLVATLKKQTKRPVVFLMGDMRELGDEAKIEHEAVAHKMISIVDYLYCVGPLTRKFILGAYPLAPISYGLKEVSWFDTAARAGEYLEKHLVKDAIVLVKGSQNTIYLEEAIKKILADKNDITRLCRQSTFWLDTKRKQAILPQ
jgi:UDP-N-acetylmuramoyl-tripeptide--D-alanyl-D-alanine ligase